MKMRAVIKKLLWLVLFGYAAGCVAFVAALFAGSAVHGGANAFVSRKTGEGLLELAVFCVILSISASAAGIIHEVKNLAFGLKALFQMVAWVVVFLAETYFFGWMEKNGAMRYILSALGVAAAGWLLCMALGLIDARKMNRKIKEREMKEREMMERDEREKR